MPAHRATFRLLCPPFVGTENRQSFQRPEPMSQPASTKRVITALSAANFVIGMGALMVVGLLSPVASDFRIPPAEAGLMMTYYAVGYAILSPLLISLTGQIGRRRILTAALFIFALSNLCALLAPTPTLLFLSRILTATGAGLFTPVAAAVAAGLSPPDRQARALAAVFFGLTLSQVMGVPAGGFIAYTFGWRAAFAMILVLTLPFIVILWRTVPAGLRFQPVSLSDLGRSITNPRDVLALLFTVFFVGSTAKQIYGVSNNPYVPRITIDATDFQAGADPDNTLAALHGMENQVDEQSNQAFQPDVLAMPQTYYNFIATARASTLNSETILTVFLRNAQWIKSVISIREFNTAGPAGLPIMVALSTQSPDFIENIVPEELEILAPLRTSPLETTVSMVGETAGMITEYPIGHLIGEFDE